MRIQVFNLASTMLCAPTAKGQILTNSNPAVLRIVSNSFLVFSFPVNIIMLKSIQYIMKSSPTLACKAEKCCQPSPERQLISVED